MNSITSFIKNNKLYTLISISVIIAIASFLIAEIYDLDIWWHLVIGRDILSNWVIPFFDKYTAAGYGQPYHDSHWFFQVLVALTDKFFGIVGVQMFMVAIWGFTIAFVWKSVNKWTKSYWAPVIIFLAAMTSIERFLPRPEIITFLMMAIFYYLLQNKKYVTKIHCIIFGLLQIIWANSHGLFVVGPFMVGCYFLIDIIEYLRKNENSIRQSSILLAVVFISSLVAPWGINGWGYSLVIFSEATAKTSAVMQIVGEMSPTFGDANRSGVAFWFYFTMLLTATIAIFSMFRYKNFTSARFLILIGMILASLTGRRNVALFAMVAAPFIAEFLIKNLNGSNSRFNFLKYLLPVIIILWAWYPLSGAYYLKLQIASRAGFGYSSSSFPDQMKPFLDKIKFKGNAYNSNVIGGYYLYNYYPNILPLTDGRWEIYKPDVINTIQEAPLDKLILQMVIDKYKINAFILTHPSSEALGLIPVLRTSPDWKLVYYYYNFSIWLRKDDPQYLAVPEIKVGSLDLPSNNRLENFLMYEIFLEGMKNVKSRIINIDKIISFNWKPEYFLEQKAQLNLQLGNLNEAEASYRKMLNYDPNSELALNELAFFAYNKGNIIEAKKLLEQILRNNPRNEKAGQNLKLILDKQKK